MAAQAPPLIAHVLHRFDVGGLENGVVNLINHLPADRFRHCIVSLTDNGASAERLRRPVPIHSLHQRPGNDPRHYWRLYRLFRRLRPALVHTRNIGAMDAIWPAWLAGVPVRVHGEHGWDVDDPNGANRRHQRIRRLFRPWVNHFVALSGFQADYLRDRVGVDSQRLSRIINGVDTLRFVPRVGAERPALLPPGFADQAQVVIGTVGRMHGVKDQLNLARAFRTLCLDGGLATKSLRLVMIGDGPLRSECQALLDAAGLTEQVWLPGARDDVADLLQAMDIFALPSQTEGISNTILEAMATGLPVVATDVGGSAELVDSGVTGALCAPSDPVALAAALRPYCASTELRQTHGGAGRRRAEQAFSLATMLQRYADMYEQALGGY